MNLKVDAHSMKSLKDGTLNLNGVIFFLQLLVAQAEKQHFTLDARTARQLSSSYSLVVEEALSEICTLIFNRAQEIRKDDVKKMSSLTVSLQSLNYGLGVSIPQEVAIAQRLDELGYFVQRDNGSLIIDWNYK